MLHGVLSLVTCGAWLVVWVGVLIYTTIMNSVDRKNYLKRVAQAAAAQGPTNDPRYYYPQQ